MLLGLTDYWAWSLFKWLTPVAIIVAALGAILTNPSPDILLGRVFLVSLSACFLVPMLIYLALAVHGGFEVLDLRNLPFAAILLGLWTLAVTILGCLLAVALTFLGNQHSTSR